MGTHKVCFREDIRKYQHIMGERADGFEIYSLHTSVILM